MLSKVYLAFGSALVLAYVGATVLGKDVITIERQGPRPVRAAAPATTPYSGGGSVRTGGGVGVGGGTRTTWHSGSWGGK